MHPAPPPKVLDARAASNAGARPSTRGGWGEMSVTTCSSFLGYTHPLADKTPRPSNPSRLSHVLLCLADPLLSCATANTCLLPMTCTSSGPTIPTLAQSWALGCAPPSHTGAVALQDRLAARAPHPDRRLSCQAKPPACMCQHMSASSSSRIACPSRPPQRLWPWRPVTSGCQAPVKSIHTWCSHPQTPSHTHSRCP